jgi:flagellar hook-associated protein 2
MSLNGNLSGISFSGLSSGIDTDSIISRLIQLEQIPISRLQQRQQQIQQQQQVYAQFRSKLQAFSAAAGALNSSAVFNPITTTSSKPEVATVSATSDALVGTYNLAVSKLAQAQKVASLAQTDSTSALGKDGQFVVNGKAVQIQTTDTLRSIAQKINDANAGVTASIIDGGAGSTYLTLASNATGLKGKIQVADLSGDSIMGFLGIISGAPSIREPITNGAASWSFGNSSDSLKSLLGLNSTAASTFEVNGVAINIDPAVDSLQTVANAINAAGTGATATVKTVTEGTSTKYRLEITGASTPTLTDSSGNLLSALGVLQAGYGHELLQAQDAEFTIDGVALTSATNTIQSAIPNATIALLKANATTPETTTLTLSKDTAAIKGKIEAFRDAYNDAIDFIRTYSQFDKDTFASGPLFGDPVAGQLEQQVTSMLFSNVAGVSGDLKNLTSIGFKLDDQGKLSIDDAILTSAIANKPTELANLFRTSGVGSVNSIQYISSTSKSIASGDGAYNVDISALATKGSYTGEIAQTLASSATEVLSFSGSVIGTTPYTLSLSVGSTLADTVTKINADTRLKDLVVASIDGSGKLRIESKRYGSGGNVTVTSNLAAAADNSGTGTSSAGVTETGTDVVGTINGEEATGNGQFLIGKTGNAKTEGLQIQYTGTALGLVGTIALRKGIGAQSTDLMATFLDSVNGILSASDASLKSQFDDLGDQIESLNDRIAAKEADLKAKFSRMEEAISRIQAQASRLSALNQSNSG